MRNGAGVLRARAQIPHFPRTSGSQVIRHEEELVTGASHRVHFTFLVYRVKEGRELFHGKLCMLPVGFCGLALVGRERLLVEWRRAPRWMPPPGELEQTRKHGAPQIARAAAGNGAIPGHRIAESLDI